MSEDIILQVLNRLAIERPQLNFDSEHVRAQIARIVYFEIQNEKNATLAKDNND